MPVNDNGLIRVLIENVQPEVDHGRYPAKRTVGETVSVTADIFVDGHDHLRAQLLYRHASSSKWSIIEMAHEVNDRWAAVFTTTETGEYRFTVKAWVDHLDSWYDGFKKKAAAGVDGPVELLEGAALLHEAAGNNAGAPELVAMMNDPEQHVRAKEKVLSQAFSDLVHQNPLIRHAAAYKHELAVRVEHSKANFSAWYELFPRSAAIEGGRHGNFKDVVRLLPRVAAMGFDVLYIPPIHPIGEINRKGRNNAQQASPGEPGSPWAIGNSKGGHKDIHPELGTLEDFKTLITEASRHGIDIAMDIAFQCAPDHPYVKAHPDWFRQRPDGSIQYAENPPKKYQDIYPFNFETDDWQALWEELRSVFFYWIEQGIRIFRVDNPHTKPIRFWEWVINEVNQKHKDIIFLSEAFTRPKVMASLAKVGFTQSYTYFTWRVTRTELTEYVNELVNGPMRNYFRPNFWPNTPDILPYHLQHQGENMFIIRLFLAATLSSNYGIYGPPFEFCENTPVEGKEEYLYSEKYEVKKYEWKRTNRMTDIITILNKARKEHAALQSTWNIRFLNIENSNLIAYFKATDDLSSIFLAVVNLDPHVKHAGYVQLPLGALKVQWPLNIKLHDLITDEHYTWTQEWNYVELDPYVIPFHLFKLEIHESNL